MRFIFSQIVMLLGSENGNSLTGHGMQWQGRLHKPVCEKGLISSLSPRWLSLSYPGIEFIMHTNINYNSHDLKQQNKSYQMPDTALLCWHRYIWIWEDMKSLRYPVIHCLDLISNDTRFILDGNDRVLTPYRMIRDLYWMVTNPWNAIGVQSYLKSVKWLQL